MNTASHEIDSTVLQRSRAYLRYLAYRKVDSGLRQRVDASDLVQQTLLDAVARSEQFRGNSETEFMAWLRQILSNNLVDAVRYYGREKRDITRNRSLDEDTTKSERRIEALIDSGSTPSQRAAAREQLERLPLALECLPEQQRTAIELHHLQGLKLSETGKRMGKSMSAVGGLVHRGLQRLRGLLAE